MEVELDDAIAVLLLDELLLRASTTEELRKFVKTLNEHSPKTVHLKVPECFVVDEFHGDSVNSFNFIVGWRLIT